MGGVVIDAQIIGHERKWRNQPRAQPARAQKAVFDAQYAGGRRRYGGGLAGPDQQAAPGVGGFGHGGHGIGTEVNRLFAAKDRLHMPALPRPHAGGDMAVTILAIGADLGLQLVDGIFEAAQTVAAGVVPCGGKQHRGGKKLWPRQGAAAMGHGIFIRAQTPARIKGLAENAGPVARKDRLEPQLRRHGIDCNRAFQQRERRDRVGQQGDVCTGIGGGIVAGTQALGGFGVGLDHDARAGIFFLGEDQHFAKG